MLCVHSDSIYQLNDQIVSEITIKNGTPDKKGKSEQSNGVLHAIDTRRWDQKIVVPVMVMCLFVMVAGDKSGPEEESCSSPISSCSEEKSSRKSGRPVDSEETQEFWYRSGYPAETRLDTFCEMAQIHSSPATEGHPLPADESSPIH